MKPLIIAMITNNYYPYRGGVVSSINAFSENLAKLGHKVVIITLDFGDYSNSNNIKYHENIKLIKIRSYIKFKYKTHFIAIPKNPYQSIKNVLKAHNINIIHTHHPFLLGEYALKLSKNLNIPIVFTYHTQYDKYAHYFLLPTKLTGPIANKIALNYVSKVDRVIAPGSEIKDFLLSNKISTKINILPSEILPVFSPKNINFNNINLNKKINLLTISRFAKEKNIYFLLKFLNLIYEDKFLKNLDINLTLAGHGNEYNNLKNYININLKKISSKIRIIKSPNKPYIAKLYKNSDIFLFASQTETQGLVLAEAMASGLPVLSLNGPGQSDIIKNNYNGYLVENSHNMLEKLKLIIFDQELYQKLRKGACNTANKYKSPNMTNKLIDIYYQLLNKNL